MLHRSFAPLPSEGALSRSSHEAGDHSRASEHGVMEGQNIPQVTAVMTILAFDIPTIPAIIFTMHLPESLPCLGC